MEQVGFTPKGAAKVASVTDRMARLDRARYNGTGELPFRRRTPKQRVGWMVRITDLPSSGDPDLYAALVLECDGYTAGSFLWEDGEACWVTLAVGDDSELEVGMELPAMRFCVNYDDGLHVYIVGRVGGGGLTTANEDGTEESTTTRLEFDQDTGVRVDAGATDGDPDTVSGIAAGQTQMGMVTVGDGFDGGQDLGFGPKTVTDGPVRRYLDQRRMPSPIPAEYTKGKVTIDTAEVRNSWHSGIDFEYIYNDRILFCNEQTSPPATGGTPPGLNQYVIGLADVTRYVQDSDLTGPNAPAFYSGSMHSCGMFRPLETDLSVSTYPFGYQAQYPYFTNGWFVTAPLTSQSGYARGRHSQVPYCVFENDPDGSGGSGSAGTLWVGGNSAFYFPGDTGDLTTSRIKGFRFRGGLFIDFDPTHPSATEGTSPPPVIPPPPLPPPPPIPATADFSVTVVDTSTGTGIAGRSVSVPLSTNNPQFTDADGECTLTDVPGGSSGDTTTVTLNGSGEDVTYLVTAEYGAGMTGTGYSFVCRRDLGDVEVTFYVADPDPTLDDDGAVVVNVTHTGGGSNVGRDVTVDGVTQSVSTGTTTFLGVTPGVGLSSVLENLGGDTATWTWMSPSGSGGGKGLTAIFTLAAGETVTIDYSVTP